MMDFIIGEKYWEFSDFVFSTNTVEYGNEDYNKLKNTFNLNKLKEINIVYLHTMYKNQFFDLIRPLNNKFIIITHNSDLNIDSVSDLPSNVIKWYAQNVNCVDDRLESLPIGLENSKWAKLFRVKKVDEIVNILTHKKNHLNNLVYMNFNMSTNINERDPLFQYLWQQKNFVTVDPGRNGKDFGVYLNNVYNHKFVVCPEGNGIDTHRTWETLYLGSIPIEKRNINNSFYTDLPICFVDKWEDITQDFLNSEYKRITNTEWNLEKLNFNYWKNKILNENIYNTL